MSIYKKINNLFNYKITLLNKKQDRYLLILICLIFSIIFLNIFVPFNINRWYSDSGFIQFFRLSSYGIVVSLVLLFTQFPLRRFFKITQFTLKTYLIWLLIEFSLINLAYIILYGNPIGNFKNDLIFSIQHTLPGVCLPYSFALLIIYYKKQRRTINSLKQQSLSKVQAGLIAFKDDKGRINFSIHSSDILFLESADNYIYIYYLTTTGIERKILRNTLKNIEIQLQNNFLIRCHRSYIVNINNIKLAQKKGKRILLTLKGTKTVVPVSSKYINQFTLYL